MWTNLVFGGFTPGAVSQLLHWSDSGERGLGWRRSAVQRACCMHVHASWRVCECGSEEGLTQGGWPAALAGGQDAGRGSGPPGEGRVGAPRSGICRVSSQASSGQSVPQRLLHSDTPSAQEEPGHLGKPCLECRASAAGRECALEPAPSCSSVAVQALSPTEPTGVAVGGCTRVVWGLLRAHLHRLPGG